MVWLFIRGDESIRITRFPTALTLLIHGPGHAEHSHKFESRASLEDFQQCHEQRLLSAGWMLVEVADRRRSGQDSPSIEMISA